MALTDRAYVASPDQLAVLPSLYQSAARWITVVGAEGSEAEGFVATIRANPTNGTIQAISQAGSLWEDILPFIAPLIKSWNATEEVVTFRDVPEELREDGTVAKPARKVADKIETVPLPAPSDGDPETILKLDPRIREWVLEQCILARLHAIEGMGLGKKDAPSAGTPDGTPAAGTNGTPSKTSRPARRSSPTP